MLDKSKIIFFGTLLVLGAAVAIGDQVSKAQSDSYILPHDTKHRISTRQLTHWIVSGRRDFQLFDMRSEKAYKSGHIKGAVRCTGCHHSKKEGRAFLRKISSTGLAPKLVLYTHDDKAAIKLPRHLFRHPGVYYLKGGYKSWKKNVLNKVVIKPTDTKAQMLAKRKHLALRNYFLGKPIISGMPVVKLKPMKVRRARTTQGEVDEGC